MHKKSFIKSAAVLGAAGLIVKLIGVLYKIPLANIIGTEGTGLYYKAYPIYTILLMLSTAGLPPAISKLVSSHIALGDKAGAQKVFKVSLALLGMFGLLSSLALYFFSASFASLQGSPLVELSIKYISPAIFFVAIMAAIRGYFQGLQNMFPTAMTQMVEQVGKVSIGLTLAYIMVPRGVEFGAAGAILGVMASEFIAMCVIIIYYLVRRERKLKNAVAYQKTPRILKDIIKLAIPILIGASIMPIVQFADSVIVTARLEAVGIASGTALSLFGIFSGFANPLVNVPGTVSLAFGVSILPVISAAKASNSPDEIKRNSKMGLKMAMLVGLPSAVGLGVLARPIMGLLYGHTLTPEQLVLAGQLLAILAGGVIFLSVLQTLNGALQGLGKVMVPVVALGVGAFVKIVLSYWLIGIAEINIYGAAISTLSCYFVASAIDIIMVKRLTGTKFGVAECVLRPLAASLLMGVGAWGSYTLLYGLLGNAASALIAVFAGVVVFALCIPLFNVLKRSEVLRLPGGSKIVKVYDKLSRREKDA